MHQVVALPSRTGRKERPSTYSGVVTPARSVNVGKKSVFSIPHGILAQARNPLAVIPWAMVGPVVPSSATRTSYAPSARGFSTLFSEIFLI